MSWPLTVRIWFTLRRAAKALSAEGRKAVQAFVRSQKRPGGYCGAGGQVEPYYTLFGTTLSPALALSPALSLKGEGVSRLAWLLLTVICGGNELSPSPFRERAGVGADLYTLFFRFLNGELRFRRPGAEALQASLRPFRLSGGGYVHAVGRPEASTNATCAALAMLHQRGITDEPSVQWLLGLQDETGGFRATPDAPIPDLLSTGVAAFTLMLCGRKPRVGVAEFVESHWLDNGGFAPTLLDDYSDVEYVFYGLLALGTL